MSVTHGLGAVASAPTDLPWKAMLKRLRKDGFRIRLNWPMTLAAEARWDYVLRGKHPNQVLAPLNQRARDRLQPIDDGAPKIVIDTTPTCETGDGSERN